MRKLSFVLAIFSILLVTLTSVAQNYVAQGDQPFPKLKSVKPYVDFSLIGATGSRNGASVGMGTQVWAKRFLFDVNTHMDSMDKVTDTKQQTGTTVRALGSAEFHFKKLFLLGGGYDWGKTFTDEWSKQSGHPFVSGGVFWRTSDRNLDQLSFKTRFYFPGTDKQNGVRGVAFNVMLPVPRSHHHLFAFWDIGIYSAYETGCPGCQRYMAGNAKMGIRFQR